MGLLDKSKKAAKSRNIVPEPNDLIKSELQFLLKLIAQSAFQGKDVQLVYDIAAKLQKQLLG
jgi:hypothetical protein